MTINYFDQDTTVFQGGQRTPFGRTARYDIVVVATSAESTPARLVLTVTNTGGKWTMKKKAAA